MPKARDDSVKSDCKEDNFIGMQNDKYLTGVSSKET